jgi:hypothetical protein
MERRTRQIDDGIRFCFLPEFSSGAAAAAAAALGVRRFGGPIHPTGRLRYIPLSPLAR